MTDYSQPLQVLFEAVVLTIVSALVITYLRFKRINPQVRRARMYLMADRIERFLLAFTVGFVALAIISQYLMGVVDLPLWSVVVASLFFLGSVIYAVYQVYSFAEPQQIMVVEELGRGPTRPLARGPDKEK